MAFLRQAIKVPRNSDCIDQHLHNSKHSKTVFCRGEDFAAKKYRRFWLDQDAHGDHAQWGLCEPQRRFSRELLEVRLLYCAHHRTLWERRIFRRLIMVEPFGTSQPLDTVFQSDPNGSTDNGRATEERQGHKRSDKKVTEKHFDALALLLRSDINVPATGKINEKKFWKASCGQQHYIASRSTRRRYNDRGNRRGRRD